MDGARAGMFYTRPKHFTSRREPDIPCGHPARPFRPASPRPWEPNARGAARGACVPARTGIDYAPMSMHPLPSVVHDPEAFRTALDAVRGQGHRVALVPTMGALHAGHLALVREAQRHARFVAVSIFVNPTQFGPNEDFARYPRTLDADVAALATVGADCVFAPSVEAMYPAGESTRIRVTGVSEPLCGARRPGHFDGVAIVVAKLFGLLGRGVAVFGRKDYQQLKVIERMTRDLMLPVEIVGHPIVREPDGLAMSSRNRYLSEAEHTRALQLSRGLSDAVRAFASGERNAGAFRGIVRARIEPVAESIDYVEVTDSETLRVYADQETVGDRALLALALRVGPARLIDNVVLGEDPAPVAEDKA